MLTVKALSPDKTVMGEADGINKTPIGGQVYFVSILPFPHDPTDRSKINSQMISNLPLAITVSLHRLLEDVNWGLHLHMSRKLLPGNEQLNRGS
jgi:hypothetical protein